MTTAIVSRAWYRNKISQQRIDLMEEHFIKSLKIQTDQDFEVHLLCHKDTVDKIRALDWGDLKTCFYVSDKKPGKESEREMDYVDANSCTYNPLTNIQIRLDIDDWIAPIFVEYVKEHFKDGKDGLLTFHPTKYLHDKKVSYFSQKTYSENKPSMFIAIYQNKPKIGIYKDMHGRMAKYFEKSHFIKEFGLCNLVVHSQNAFTKP